MSKKVARIESKANGRPQPKTAKTPPKTAVSHEVKASKTPAKPNRIQDALAHTNEHHKKPAEKHEPRIEKFHGLLQDFNMSPRGGIEGFVLHSDGQTVQINVTPEVGFAAVRGINQIVEVTVEPESFSGKLGKGDHPVFRLITLTGADGKPLIQAGNAKPEPITLQGVVKRINFARHGAANGVVLENGDFVHVRPDVMKRRNFKSGDPVNVEGTFVLMPLGQKAIEAKTIVIKAEAPTTEAPPAPSS